ncbi:MAG: thioredoxin-disulfide reductase [Lachnospiraceae bacterium]|jgi:thioredoxin reductase (NADPH)|nr:thioredoxin-disulfide reductase [Lachnospiraceae bacterium]MCI1656120.1 thioredoxin-disulfide reductase [Lachnospiraceae bacterium]MCI2194602.1 thioredoxin-disulfide reductase [Lachnospiraceae bacterium]
MKDIIIIGGGPAGLSAAIYGVRAGKSVLILEGNMIGGQILNTPEIENYPGIPHISGFEFVTGLQQQATDLGAELAYEAVTSVEDLGDHKVVHTAQNAYPCKAVILATGAKNRPMGLEKEEELIGKGISYCATCDGMFYRGKVTAVYGGGNTALEDAAYLSNVCEKVYLIHRRDQFRGDEQDVERLRKRDNVVFLLDSVIDSLKAEDRLTGLVLRNVKTGELTELAVDGLFVAIGQMPVNDVFSNITDLDGKGYIQAGEDCRTNTPGVFTAGDCRTKDVRQLTTAAADGAVAALAASAYIG